MACALLANSLLAVETFAADRAEAGAAPQAELSALAGLSVRPAASDADENPDGIGYGPGLQLSFQARGYVWSWLNAAVYYRRASHEIDLPRGAAGLDYQHISIDKVLAYSLGARLEPTYHVSESFRTWVSVGVGFQFVFGFILALLLNRRFPGRGLVRSLSLIPWVTPGVLIGLMWRWIFDGNYGVLNDILLKLGMIQDKVPFLAQEATAFPAVILTIIWQGIPFFALMLLAGLQGIPDELYDSADVDGANGIQKFFLVTIPSLRSVIFVTTLLRIIWVANSVDVIFNLTEGGPAYTTQTLSVYIFNKGNALNLSYASTMSIMLTLLLSLVAILYLKNIFRKQEGK